ncbi:MAG TPA: prohibitin family protein [Candidatus Thermoplasmatota archaeon]|nr:prohibitin family protein [Candidatus Thermoplasmatota archaeon]
MPDPWPDERPRALTWKVPALRPRLLVGIAVALAVLLLVAGSLHSVDAGERAVVFHSNGALTTLTPGKFQFVVPILNTVTTYNVQSQLYRQSAEGISKDIQVVTTEVAVLYHPDVERIVDLHRDLGPEYAARIVPPSVQDAVKSAVSYWNAEELTASTREKVKQDISTRITTDLRAKNLVVDQVSITDFDFSPQFNAATEAKVVAQQKALEARNNLERAKYEANQTIIQATAQSEAARLLSQSTSGEQGQAYLFLEWLKRWNGVLPQFMGGSAPEFVLPLPSAK